MYPRSRAPQRRIAAVALAVAAAIGLANALWRRTPRTASPRSTSLSAAEALKAVEKKDDPGERCPALLEIAESLGKADEKSEALRVAHLALKAAEEYSFADSLVSDARSDALGAVALTLAHLGNVQEALDLAASIPTAYSRHNALIKLSDALAAQGHPREACQVALAAAKSASKVEDPAGWPNYHTSSLRNAVKTLAQRGMIPEALVCAQETVDASYLAGSKALGELALILAKAKERHAQAGEIALQGLKVAESVSSCSDDRCHALEDIAEVLLTLGKAPEARTATRHAWALWKREKDKIYTEPFVHLQAIATLFAKLGQNKEAQEVAEMHLKLAKAAPHSGELPFAVETFAKIGRLEDARKIAESIPDSWERQEALKSITEFGG